MNIFPNNIKQSASIGLLLLIAAIAAKIKMAAPVSVNICERLRPYFIKYTHTSSVGSSIAPAIALFTKKLPLKRTRPGAD